MFLKQPCSCLIFGPNFTHFKSQQFDAWYDKALSEVNDSLRISLYQRMDSLVIAEAPVVPLFIAKVPAD